MSENIANLKNLALAEINAANATAEIESLRIKYLGRKGELTVMLKQMGAIPAEERPAMGAMINITREEIENTLAKQRESLSAEEFNMRLASEYVDVTIPTSKAQRFGNRHPLYQVWDDTVEIFLNMGFTMAEGPEVELSEYCFDKLNTLPGHPARDRRDTFYLDEDGFVCMRTQTSSVQIRTMEAKRPPIRIISPGRVYRKDEIDATHSPIFHQVEGLVIDKGVTMGQLKWTLNELMRGLYGADVRTRFRPHNFPYTEPSCEVDVQCFECGGKGCRVCKDEGWIELLGAGMVHPKVLAGCGIDPEAYSGFAFGIGIERLTMRRFKIPDMRLLYENDFRFLRQFN
ncbi:MAG: phenylalanine--tRNA ligase subunit alpha [Oscillospiraceae bacterium]|jgi:phenylalanyl-tRNA synthetase alpha chain|nr:phenylalanine--tRNA ligase subunit alpha [Oscillospiraceae bacterium]